MTRMNDQQKRAIEIHKTLLKDFGEPIWRNPLPALDELVSTILSQNTNDVNRDRAFDALRAKSADQSMHSHFDRGGSDLSRYQNESSKQIQLSHGSPPRN